MHNQYDIRRNILMGNFFSLSVLQAVNYILPLVTVPYLVRVLGPEKFGLIAFAQAFIQFFTILVDYGFNYSATRKISIAREDRDSVSRVFSSVIIIKALLAIASFCILIILILTIPRFKDDWLVYVFTFGTLIGNMLLPVWFFQGIEHMKYITFVNIIAKSIFTFSIFIFIRSQADYLYVPLFNSFGFILAGVFSLLVAKKTFGVVLKFYSWHSVVEELKEGWHLFVSTIAINFYTGSNTFILGLVTSNTIVGYYSAAEKLIKAILGLLVPVSQTIYPYISKLASESKDQAIYFLKKIRGPLVAIAFAVSSIIFIFARPIVNIVLGTQYNESIIVFRILAFLPFIISAATVYAQFFLLGFGHSRALTRVMVISALANLIFAFIFIYILSLTYIGAAVSWFLTECCVLVISYIFYRRLDYAHR